MSHRMRVRDAGGGTDEQRATRGVVLLVYAWLGAVGCAFFVARYP
eukprot:gene625-13147_t